VPKLPWVWIIAIRLVRCAGYYVTSATLVWDSSKIVLPYYLLLQITYCYILSYPMTSYFYNYVGVRGVVTYSKERVMNEKMKSVWASVSSFSVKCATVVANKSKEYAGKFNEGFKKGFGNKDYIEGVVPEPRITGVTYFEPVVPFSRKNIAGFVMVEDAAPDPIEEELTTLFHKEQNIEECAPVVVIGENDTAMHVLNDDEQLDMFLAQIRS